MDKYYFWMGVLLAFVIIIRIYEPKIKGYIGESRVNSTLDKLSNEYITLKDLLLETEKGTTQVDHVVVCPKGIFVIETKNYDGWIYGSDNQKYWTQVIYKNKNKFYNPVWQNKGHISAIRQKIIGIGNLPIYSIVAFGGGCTLKKINCDSPVIYMNSLKKYIRDFQGDRILSESEISQVISILNRENIVDKDRRKEHIRYVRGMK
ncbi:nuclease-related domain-containing protein [Clostridium sp. LP20]|uniref:nuclease-related domain-containing protein n=1 Tax=Clostridium sp. LP20 TaxID=3418665 RepID=UPI003EE7437F